MWEFWVTNSGRFRAAVFRPDVGNPKRFTIVGINDITISSDMINQKVSYKVPTDDAVVVKSGDMIGVLTLEEEVNPHLHAGSDQPHGYTATRWSVHTTDTSTLVTSDVITTARYRGGSYTSLSARVLVSVGE